MFIHTLKGLKKVFIAEVFALFSEILMLISMITMTVFLSEEESQNALTIDLILSMAMLAALGLSFVAFLLYLIGVIQSVRDDTGFKVALVCIIACILLRIVTLSFFSVIIVKNLCEIMLTLINLMATLYVIQGIRNLANRLGNEQTEEKGEILFKSVTVISVLDSLLTIIVIIISNTRIENLTPVFEITSEVLSVIQCVMFATFLLRAIKMLKSAQANELR